MISTAPESIGLEWPQTKVHDFSEEEMIEEPGPDEPTVLSDDTKIRGVCWGDFKDEAMELDFEPSNFFVSLRFGLIHRSLVSTTKRGERAP